MSHRIARYSMGLFISLLFLLGISLGVGISSVAGAEYQDINSSNADQSYIKYLSQKGIIKGYPDGSFKPKEGLSRAQAAVIMVKAGQISIDPNAVSPFKDLKADHWARPYIVAAVKAGYINSYPDGTYKPEQKLSRAEGISLLLRLSKQSPNATLPTLKDIKSQHWAAKAVAVGLASGMVGLSADGQNYFPNAPFNRINMAHALGILISEDPGFNASSLTGQIKAIQGSTRIKKAGSQSEEQLTQTTAVNPGDIIITDPASSAELSYPDGSSMLIKADSQISIKEAKGKKYIKSDGQEGIAVDWLNLDMKQGTMFVALATRHENDTSEMPEKIGLKTKELADLYSRESIAAAVQNSNQSMPWYEASRTKKVRIKVDMPWGMAGVRGTFVVISVAPGGQATVSCLTGDAEVSNAGQTVVLGQNQSTGVNAQPSPPAPAAPLTALGIQLFAQEKSWIQETARRIDQNQVLVAPPPPPAVPGSVTATTVTGQQNPAASQVPAANNSTTTMQTVNNALGAIGSSSPSNNSSSSGGTTTPAVIENSLGQNVPVTSGNPMSFAGGVTINLGNNSILTGATVKVDSVTTAQLVMDDLQAGGPILSFQFANMNIDQPVEISLPVNAGADASKAGIYYYNSGSWEYQNSRLENGVLKATVNHFSIYGVLIDNTAPADLNLQSGAITNNSIALSFSAQDRAGIKNYAIYRDGEKIHTTSETQYTDTNLNSGQAYSYQIQAIDIFNNQSGLSQPQSYQTTAGIINHPEPNPVQTNAEVLIQGNHYSLPITGSQAGTSKISSLNLTGIIGASQWQIKVGSGGFPVPVLDSTVSGAVYYASGLDITANAGQNLLLLATDATDKIKAYADIPIDASMIYIPPISAPQLILGTNYSAPVPGSAKGKTKIANLNLGSFAPTATQWQIKVGSSSFPVPDLNSTVSGAVYYAAGVDIEASVDDHLLLLATDDTDKVKSYADIELENEQTNIGTSWIWRNPLPTGNGIKAVAYGGGKWVAVGGCETILTSSNGSSWTARNMGMSNKYLYDVAWNGSQWVAVGTSGIFTSSNGNSWTKQDTGTEAGFNQVMWNGSLWLALGYKTILTSSDGSSWTVRYSDTADLTHINWNGSQWVAVGWNGAILTSNNGINWTAQNSGYTGWIKHISWNGSQWVAVSYRYILTSSDGIDWDIQDSGIDNMLNRICWNGSQWVVVGDCSTILTSSNGSIWTKQQSVISEHIEDIVWNGSQWVAATINGNIMTSNDGINWIKSTVIEGGINQASGNGSQWVVVGGYYLTSSDGVFWAVPRSAIEVYELNRIKWNGSQWVAVGHNGTVVTSDNGINWVKQNTGSTKWLRDLAWNGSQWVAVGDSGTILTSSNGTSWIIQNAGTTQGLKRVIWNGSQWMAVGESGTIVTSSNGNSWAVQNAGITDSLEDLVWNSGQWVAVGFNRSILTSDDGISWTKQNAGITGPIMFTKIAWNGSQWLAIGGPQPTIVTSNNGISWTKQNISISGSLLDVAWNGSQWVAVGGSPANIVTSSDGINWTKQNAGITGINNLTKIAWNGSQWLAIGGSGTVLTSSDGTNWSIQNSGTNRGLITVDWNGSQWVVVGLNGVILQSVP